jgi:ABC-type histidine transport system ATPase subunit
MQLIEMRFAKIDGTDVRVQVNSAAEAKEAIKELKHKKKELALLKKRLIKEERASRSAHDRAERETQRIAKARGFMASVRRVGRLFRKPAPIDAREPELVAADIRVMDDIAHNIDSCIVQLEGKLLRMG